MNDSIENNTNKEFNLLDLHMNTYENKEIQNNEENKNEENKEENEDGEEDDEKEDEEKQNKKLKYKDYIKFLLLYYSIHIFYFLVCDKLLLNKI